MTAENLVYKAFALSVTFGIAAASVCAGQAQATPEPSNTIGQLAVDPSFKPVAEAPLPKNFPPHTPVGKIEVKNYPAYRKAEATGAVAFWTLFGHIKSADIPMTAPVEMTYQVDGPPAGRERAMAFLYENPETGSPGRQGNVEVIDVPAATVLSIGVRGPRSDAVLAEAERMLRTWLEQNKTRYEQGGPIRVMGYNSPFVARDRQFFEVQMPIRDGTGKTE